MENASDALIMAGQVLIFIVALTVCISSFTTVRAEVNRIVGETETVRFAKGESGYINFIESRNNDSNRVVGAETLTSSLYRAIKENYVIYIRLNNYNGIDSSIVNITKATRNVTINGTAIISEGNDIIKVTIGADTNQSINQMLNDGGLYDQIRNLTFNEYLGEYQNATEGVNSANKQVYRIITYVEI